MRRAGGSWTRCRADVRLQPPGAGRPDPQRPDQPAHRRGSGAGVLFGVHDRPVRGIRAGRHCEARAAGRRGHHAADQAGRQDSRPHPRHRHRGIPRRRAAQERRAAQGADAGPRALRHGRAARVRVLRHPADSDRRRGRDRRHSGGIRAGEARRGQGRRPQHRQPLRSDPGARHRRRCRPAHVARAQDRLGPALRRGGQRRAQPRRPGRIRSAARAGRLQGDGPAVPGAGCRGDRGGRDPRGGVRGRRAGDPVARGARKAIGRRCRPDGEVPRPSGDRQRSRRAARSCVAGSACAGDHARRGRSDRRAPGGRRGPDGRRQLRAGVPRTGRQRVRCRGKADCRRGHRRTGRNRSFCRHPGIPAKRRGYGGAARRDRTAAPVSGSLASGRRGPQARLPTHGRRKGPARCGDGWTRL